MGIARISTPHQGELIREGASSPTLGAELELLERELAVATRTASELREVRRKPIVLPSTEELRAMARKEFADLGRDSFEFARIMRRLTPRIVVFPHRLCDGGHVVLYAS